MGDRPDPTGERGVAREGVEVEFTIDPVLSTRLGG
jgi:hypothetical protein